MPYPGAKLNGGFLRDGQDRVIVSANPVAYEQGGTPVDADGAIVISPETNVVWPHVFLTQAAYDALAVKDPNTLYFII
jgi:hypothetical protein